MPKTRAPYVAVHLKPSTQEMYETALRKHWMRSLGSLPLSAITREHVKTRLGEMLTAGLKPSRVKGALNIVRACLNAAVEDGVILGNPAARAGKFAGRSGTAREVEAFPGRGIGEAAGHDRPGDAGGVSADAHARPYWTSDRRGPYTPG